MRGKQAQEVDIIERAAEELARLLLTHVDEFTRVRNIENENYDTKKTR